MRYRKLSATGDYTFGNGGANFWVNSPQGVAQSVQTRLLLFQGEWFLDQTEGLPLTQDIIGYSNQALYDSVIRTRILDTVGVSNILSYQSLRNPTTRKLTVSATIQTIYSPQPVVVPPVII